MKRHRNKALLASLAAMAGLLGGNANATPLDVLVGGGTLTSDSGDILFSGFAALNGATGGTPEMLRYMHIDPNGSVFLAMELGEGISVTLSRWART